MSLHIKILWVCLSVHITCYCVRLKKNCDCLGIFEKCARVYLKNCQNWLASIWAISVQIFSPVLPPYKNSQTHLHPPASLIAFDLACSMKPYLWPSTSLLASNLTCSLQPHLYPPILLITFSLTFSIQPHL